MGEDMQGLVSVIVPVYNAEKYLPKCLQSIASQSYKNMEVILVDDGSTDASGSICDAWAGKDSRFTVIHKANGGVANARNEGIASCTGDYIGFVDADDWIEPEMYAMLAEACNCADMAACGYIDYPVGLDSPIPIGRTALETDSFEEAALKVYERDGYFSSIWNKLFRREAVMPNGHPIAFDGTLFVGEDEVWLLQVMCNCRFFSFIPKPCYHYRPTNGSATRLDQVTDRRMTVLTAKQRAISLLADTDRAAARARSVLYNDCFLMRVQCYAAGDRERLKKIVQALKPMRRFWLRADDLPLLRKLKVLLMEMEMALHLPGRVVLATSGVKGYRARGIHR